MSLIWNNTGNFSLLKVQAKPKSGLNFTTTMRYNSSRISRNRKSLYRVPILNKLHLICLTHYNLYSQFLQVLQFLPRNPSFDKNSSGKNLAFLEITLKIPLLGEFLDKIPLFSAIPPNSLVGVVEIQEHI